MKTALYTGSFDPITNGHLNIIQKASKLFDKIIILIANNANKNYLFDIDNRISMLKKSLSNFNNIQIEYSDGLIVDAIDKYKANCVIRGVRNSSDFDYEQQMANMNKQLNHNCETIFLMPDAEYASISSTLVKEIALNNGNIEKFIPLEIQELFISKINEKKLSE